MKQNPLNMMPNNGPQCYRVCCSECSYMETVELSREHDEPGGPRSVAELPKVCPVCGAGVTRKRIPVLIRY